MCLKVKTSLYLIIKNLALGILPYFYSFFWNKI